MLVVLAVALSDCGGAGDSATGTAPDAPAVPASVVIFAPSQSIVVGHTVQLLASARDAAGNTISGATVVWSSSAVNVASVDAAGVVTGISPGAVTITARATLNGVSASVSTQVTVAAPPASPVLTSVVINAASTSVVIGGTLQLTATPRDQSGNPIAATVTWISSALGIATVSGTGLVTGNVTGNAIMTAVATAGNVTVSADLAVTVSPVPLVLTTVTIGAPATTLRAGATLQSTAVAKDQNGNAIAASVAWGTSDPTKATVNASGLVTGVAAGSVTISALASASGVIVSNAVSLTVLPPLVLTSVVVTPSPAPDIQPGGTLQLSASARDQNNDPIAATITWATLDAGMATVTATGLVTGVSPGAATITATATAGGVVVSRGVLVSVLAPPVLMSVVVSPGSASIMEGTTVGLTAIPMDQYGAAIAASVTWGTSNAAKATVNGSGTVTGVAAGGATITATATAGGVTVMGTAAITVTAAPVLSSVLVLPGSPSIGVGGSVQLTASPRDQFNNPIAAAISWGTSDGSKATVSGSGLVTGVAAGSATITATATAGPVMVSSGVSVTVTAGFPLTAGVTATAGLQFVPGTVDIARTGTVTWTFAFTHDVTFSGPPGSIGVMSSGSASLTFNTVGVFSYTCTLHGGMGGTVIVH